MKCVFAYLPITVPLITAACSWTHPLSRGYVEDPRFPDSSIFYQEISDAAVDPYSDAMIAAIATNGGWAGGELTFNAEWTILQAGSSVIPQEFTPADDYYFPDCDEVPFPLLPGAVPPLSYGATMIVYQGSTLYEVYYADEVLPTCEAVWDLHHDYWQPGNPYSRGDECTAADSSGMPIAPLLVTAVDIASGSINHALRMELTELEGFFYVHPATRSVGVNDDAAVNEAPPVAGLPTGTRLRLRSTFDTKALPANAALVAVALQKYGAFVNGNSNSSITVDLNTSGMFGQDDLASIAITDLEVVMPQDGPDGEINLPHGCDHTPLLSVPNYGP